MLEKRKKYFFQERKKVSSMWSRSLSWKKGWHRWPVIALPCVWSLLRPGFKVFIDYWNFYWNFCKRVHSQKHTHAQVHSHTPYLTHTHTSSDTHTLSHLAHTPQHAHTWTASSQFNKLESNERVSVNHSYFITFVAADKKKRKEEKSSEHKFWASKQLKFKSRLFRRNKNR